MGSTWKFTMVLWSTLAALVIIVNSAEEEYENQYRRGMRQRSMDLETRRFEQPWRTLEAEPVMQQPSSSHSREGELEDISEEPAPRRRRPGRKRKRRPEPASPEESNERIKYEEYTRPRFDEFSNEHLVAEQPKRRRKKIEKRVKWAESLEEDRPMRKRGQRRKRPSVDTYPDLSEFSGYRPSQNPRPVDTEISTDQVITKEKRNDLDKVIERPTDPLESREILVEESMGSKTNDKPRSKQTIELRPVESDDSSSDSSNENLEFYAQGQKKGQVDSGPIDPLTLKDILKKSNGTSLSEILQQHNLSLADLLHGKELALSILKTGNNLLQVDTPNVPKEKEDIDSSEEKLLINSETKYATITELGEIPSTTEMTTSIIEDETTLIEEITTTEKPIKDTTIAFTNRRYPNGMRRYQRNKPGINTYKSQINRDLVALTARKQVYNNNRRRNVTKLHEWRDVIPLMKNVSEIISVKPKIETTTENTEVEVSTVYEEVITTTDISREYNETSPVDASQNETEVIEEDLHKNDDSEKDKQNTLPETISETNDTVELRREAFNNLIKKKRRKQNYSTAQSSQDDSNIKNNAGASSEFTEKTQGSKTNLDDVTIFDDITTSEPPKDQEKIPVKVETKATFVDEKHRRRNKFRKIRYTTKSPNRYYKPVFVQTTTEESAKIEIDEILSDESVNERLSRILKERNMTLNELVEHRERGSSHVHLADIFHNASREPNPPEPFLSKSAIEPISKETYPLRALLDAHDTTTKATTIEPVQEIDIRLPLKKDFSRNKNENSDNMGIMSLFHNITQTDTEAEESQNKQIRKDSDGTPYSTSIIAVNANDGDKNETDTARDGRAMYSINSNPDDIVGWNEIFSLMRRSYENKTKTLKGLVPAESLPKVSTEEELDGDALIVLEDMRRLNELNKIESISNNVEEHVTEIPMNTENTHTLNHMMNAKSVTLATASIFGLALVLFLLTYIAYRWKQQRNSVEKTNYPEEIIPTPVFENRKGHKNNSSTRSISPMLTSNIYTLSTMDSQNGKESPDYMWDSLRKPFQ